MWQKAPPKRISCLLMYSTISTVINMSKQLSRCNIKMNDLSTSFEVTIRNGLCYRSELVMNFRPNYGLTIQVESVDSLCCNICIQYEKQDNPYKCTVSFRKINILEQYCQLEGEMNHSNKCLNLKKK